MPSRYSFLLLCLGLLLLGTAATAAWHPVADPLAVPAAPRLEASGPVDAVRIEMTLPGVEIGETTVGAAAYSVVTVPGGAPLLRPGEPSLPLVARSIAIAPAGTPELKIVQQEWEEIPAAPPLPSKGSLTRDIDPATVPYTFGKVYERGGLYPERAAELTEPFLLRDVRGVGVRIFPVAYDFDRGVLRVLRRIVLEVVTRGSGGKNVLTVRHDGVDPQFAAIYRRLLLNETPAKYQTIAHPGRMLVVTADAYLGAVQPFVAWKIQEGIPVEVVTTSSVGGTAAGIRDAITTRYNEPEGLTYVVLVGDIEDVPTNSGPYEGADSDPVYAMVAGSDSYPDLFVSRISAQNATEVQIQVNKFIRYERDPDTGAAAAWYHRACGIASNEGTPTDYERCDLLRDDLLAYTFTEVDQIYQPTGTTADITAALNAGRSLVNYLGHGSGTSWGSVYFANSDIDNLANGWAHPWILDVSCSNGDFSLATCFAEAWLRAGTVSQPTGAVASYSASTLADWVPPTVMQAHAVDLLVGDQARTLGALYFYGGMQVLDDYPAGEGQKLIEQYNIFGDCSLVVRTDEPATLAVTHPPVLHFGETVFPVETGVAGARVCLSRDGVILGSGVADAAGHVDVVLAEPVTTPGDVTLTVTGYNLVPAIETVPAAAASQVTVTPDTIPVQTPTDVTVTILDADGITPLAGIDVWAEGFGYATTPVTTDTTGTAVVPVDAPYGPGIEIVGRRPGDEYDLFRAPVAVLAQPLTSPDLTVTTDIGLADAFPLDLPAVLHAQVGESGAELHALLPGGADTTTTAAEMTLTVTQQGSVTGTIALPGHDLYSETFDVIVPYGTLAGHVGDGTGDVAGAVVVGHAGGQVVFSAVCDDSGHYAVPDSVPVGEYELTVDQFGYLPFSENIFLQYGPNDHDIVLAPAPRGTLTGKVTDAVDGSPLAATVQVFRADNGDLYAEAACDTTDGSFTVPDLPYADYVVTVRAQYHRTAAFALTVDQPELVKAIALQPTAGNILIVDDGGARGATVPAKLDPKTGKEIAPAYQPGATRSAAEMAVDLENLGYAVTVETAAATDPTTWPGYDLLVVASGGNTSNLSDPVLRSALVNYVQGGGHLLIEGGEIAYLHQDDAAFAASVLHILAWDGDSSGDLLIADPAHHAVSVPNVVGGPVPVAYVGYGDADRVTPAADAQAPGAWTDYPSLGSIVCFDPNPAPEGGQVVYYTFNYAAAEAGARVDLLEDAVTWLLTEEVGDAAVSGTVVLPGSDPGGVTVTAVPGGGSVVTGTDGSFTLTGLFGGNYTLRATKAGWTTATTEIALAAGQTITGITLTLYRAVEETTCSGPALAIPDNDAAGVADTLYVTAPGVDVSGLAVQVDITHTYQGDLVVELVSPSGTVVTLHDRSGGGTDDIHGWYPDELAPAGNLDALLGEPADGAWILRVRDLASYDTGTLDSWCLRLTLPDLTTAAPDAPRRLDLAPNYPNPFNPSTRLTFTLPRQGRVSLRIYDPAGRLVRTLVEGELPAGVQQVTWNGRDAAGRSVGAGVYFARLVTPDGERLQKMLLVK